MPGSTTNATFSEYIYFDGKRAARRDYQSNVFYYFADQVGSARGMAEVASGSHTATPCFDADFYPFGGEHDFLNSCPQNYKFMGKERDPETNNDDFGARSYASAYGRFLSPDWSSTPTPIPYANLTNPQTLNLYAIVNDNPESFADLDGHDCHTASSASQASNDCVQPPPAQNAGTAQNQAASSAHSASFDAHADAINATTVDKNIGVTTNVKMVGGSVSGTASSDPKSLSANAEVHVAKSEITFTSSTTGGPGLVEGKIGTNFGTAEANAQGSLTNGAGVKAEASVVSISGTVKVGSFSITGTINGVSVGGQVSLTSRSASAGLNLGVGADLSISWGSQSLTKVSAEAK